MTMFDGLISLIDQFDQAKNKPKNVFGANLKSFLYLQTLRNVGLIAEPADTFLCQKVSRPCSNENLSLKAVQQREATRIHDLASKYIWTRHVKAGH